MGIADLHIHTAYSPDGTATVRAVMKKAREVDLNVIAITDHDEIRGSLEGQDLSSAYGVEVIPASEVSTADGHLLALFINRKIPKGLSLAETLHHIADQGGIAVAPHPGGQKSLSLQPDLIHRTMQDPELAKILVGMEIFNACMWMMGWNGVAVELALEHPFALVGNSDAHVLMMIGKGATSFHGKTAATLRQDLEAKHTMTVTMRPDPRLLLAADWLGRLVMRYAGWVNDNTNPQTSLHLARLSHTWNPG
jgi:predicted metal-dependent phosphoesterase TrpH